MKKREYDRMCICGHRFSGHWWFPPPFECPFECLMEGCDCQSATSLLHGSPTQKQRIQMRMTIEKEIREKTRQ